MRALKAFFVRLTCPHKVVTLLAIEWDGTVVYRCDRCGKHIRQPL